MNVYKCRDGRQVLIGECDLAPADYLWPISVKIETVGLFGISLLPSGNPEALPGWKPLATVPERELAVVGRQLPQSFKAGTGGAGGAAPLPPPPGEGAILTGNDLRTIEQMAMEIGICGRGEVEPLAFQYLKAVAEGRYLRPALPAPGGNNACRARDAEEEADEPSEATAMRELGLDPDGGLIPLPKRAEPETNPYVPNKWGNH